MTKAQRAIKFNQLSEHFEKLYAKSKSFHHLEKLKNYRTQALKAERGRK